MKKKYSLPLAYSLPALCIVYLHYASIKPPPSTEIPAYKKQHSPSINRITP